MNKTAEIVGILAGLAGIVSALYMMRGTAAKAAAGPAPAPWQQYHPANNPNGFVWSSGDDAYVRQTPEGVKEFYI